MSELFALPHPQFVPKLEPADTASVGRKGELKWIALRELYIDPSYQREILATGKKNIGRIVEEFSWALFAPLVVARRGGHRYAIIDGQHRAVAAKLRGDIGELPCLVLDCAREDEAHAFAAINGRVTRLHRLQVFRAEVAGGDQKACELVKFCASAGVSIAPYPKMDVEPGETMALGSIMICRKRFGDKLTLAALKIVRAVDDGRQVNQSSIRGTCELFHRKPYYLEKTDAVQKAIASRGLVTLLNRAIERKGTRGGTEFANFSAVLEDVVALSERGVDSRNLQRMMAGR